jgi:hypothetical protein
MRQQEERLEIITFSDRTALDQCRRLCESVDRYVPAGIVHRVVVPEEDFCEFALLQSDRRTVVTTRGALSGRYRLLPGEEPSWVDIDGCPVLANVMDTLFKLSATNVTDAELLLFADTDQQFMEAFDLGGVYRHGRLRLHRVHGASSEARDGRRQRRAGALLGIDRNDFGADYSGQLITWRRSQLLGLQDHISAVHGVPWHIAVSRSLDFSEHALYGGYIEHVVGPADNGHYYDERSLSRSRQSGARAGAGAERRVTRDIADRVRPSPSTTAAVQVSNLQGGAINIFPDTGARS